MRCTFLPALAGLLVGTLTIAGCAGAQKSGEEESRPARRQAARTETTLRLAPGSNQVGTVQLYREEDEASLPVYALGSGERLRLEFDLLEEAGRPLSVYFYHADRSWRRDLSPVQYLSSFQRDDLLEYTLSQATEVPYVHYTYQFPNRNIGLLVSGNYVLRVTEQGDEEAVLFERPFFVSEQSASLDFYTDEVMMSGSGFPSVQPYARFVPPQDFATNVFDYNVCFVRNSRFDLARCSDRPMLAQQPELQFYLEPEVAFQPEGAPYFLDLSVLQVSNRIIGVDRTVSPFQVVLEPDLARFGGDGMGPMLGDSPVVSAVVREVIDPDVSGEYVMVRFAYVPPDELQLAGDVIVSGTFNAWRVDRKNRLTWVPAERRYEGEVLMKQGYHEYRYLTRDARMARESVLPRAQNQYAAFVYYRDPRLNTDRLLAVRTLVAE